jgi:hypothetical protein
VVWRSPGAVLIVLLVLIALGVGGFKLGRLWRDPSTPGWPRTVARPVITVPIYRLGLPPAIAPPKTTTTAG